MPNINTETATLIELWTKSTLINRKLDATLGAVHGIGFTEYMALYHLFDAPNHVLRRIDLAHLLGRSASGVTKMLNPMEKIGLVGKEVNPRDARVSLVKITASGTEIFQQASDTVNKTAESILTDIKSPGTKQLMLLLQSMNI